jgi:hypothetical protein
MDLRPYVVVAEIRNGSPGAPPYEIRLVDAFSLEEACRQVVIETWGRYGHEHTSVNVVLVAPQTVRNLRAAVDVMRDLPLMRMAPLGMVA